MCKQNNRAFKAITFTIGIYFFIGGQVHAYEGWNLQLEPMYMGVAGVNNHQANITTTTTTTSTIYQGFTPPYPAYVSAPIFTIYSSSTSSQNFDMGGNATFRGQLEYMPEDWGVGVSGWWFDTSGSINQNLNSSPIPSLYSPVTTSSTVTYNSNNFSLYAPPSNSGRVRLYPPQIAVLASGMLMSMASKRWANFKMAASI
jgi:hypothetical protein